MKDVLTKIQLSLSDIAHDVHRNTKDLEEHKRGVQQCQSRIDVLEDTQQQIVGAGKMIRWVGVLIPLILIGFKVVDYLSK